METEIIVRHISENKAVLSLIKDKDEVLTTDAYIGRNGMGKTREGDGKTPVGTFGIITAFGLKENPGTPLPYLDITPDTWCCGDEHFYNRIIDIKQHPHDCKGERMADYSPEYNYGFFIDYNSECEPGRGSAIFFHCKGSKPYTAGCVAIDEDKMIELLRQIDTKTKATLI